MREPTDQSSRKKLRKKKAGLAEIDRTEFCFEARISGVEASETRPKCNNHMMPELMMLRDVALAENATNAEFWAAARHDLQQPMHAAHLYILNVLDEVRGTKAEGLAQKVAVSLVSIENLLNAVHDLSQLEKLSSDVKVCDFPLCEVLDLINHDFQPLAAKKGLCFKMSPNASWVRSDKTYLRRILQNLVINAIKYTDEGRVLVGCRLRGSRLQIQVWDTGIGISQSDQISIFEEFFRLEQTKGKMGADAATGAGLGLAIVKQACDRLYHDLTLRSKPGWGSVFSVTLPLAPAQSRIRGQ